MISNRTPHPLTILPASAGADAKPTLVLPPADRGEVARVETTAHPTDTVVAYADGKIDVVAQRWGSVVGLAAPGGSQVVSAIVAAAMIAEGQDTRHVLVPADQVRDGQGRIVGCRGLLRAEDAVPRLGPVPQVVIFGSAARAGVDPIGDIDVGYCGMDIRTARTIAATWAGQRGHRTEPFDLRCLPSRDGHQIQIPRPGRLGPEDEAPLETAVVPIFGPASWGWKDGHTLASKLRRTEELYRGGVAHDIIVRLLAHALAEPHVIVLCDTMPADMLDGDSYLDPTLGQVRRAYARLKRLSSTLFETAVQLALDEGAPVAAYTLKALLAPVGDPHHCGDDDLHRLREIACPPHTAAAGSPPWQMNAGRLRLLSGPAGQSLVGGDFGPRWADRDIAAILDGETPSAVLPW